MLDLKEGPGGTEGVGEIRECPCEVLRPVQIQFPPQRRYGMGGFKDQQMPWFLPRLEVLLVLKQALCL